jgi:hypothetical protein
MATWKRLTRQTSGRPIDVNMDHVVDIESEQGANYTAITFDFAVGNIPYKIGVKETPDEIHRSSLSFK